MTIHVSTTQAGIPGGAFPDATGWHVDDNGQLHITKSGSGNIATYHPGAWASVERSADAQSRTAGVAIKVACPVCGQRLEYHHAENEAWGVVGMTDFGIVELTAHDKGAVIGPHMREHHADGSWEKVLRQRAANLAAMVKRLDERQNPA